MQFDESYDKNMDKYGIKFHIYPIIIFKFFSRSSFPMVLIAYGKKDHLNNKLINF